MRSLFGGRCGENPECNYELLLVPGMEDDKRVMWYLLGGIHIQVH